MDGSAECRAVGRWVVVNTVHTHTPSRSVGGVVCHLCVRHGLELFCVDLGETDPIAFYIVTRSTIVPWHSSKAMRIIVLL